MMRKHISQYEARRMRRLIALLKKEVQSLDRVQERRLITSWDGLPSSFCDEVRILTYAGFRVEVRAEGSTVKTYAVRHKECINWPEGL